MRSTERRKKQDKSTREIYRLLKEAFPNLPDSISEVVYRYNSVSVRVCVIDSMFEGKSFSEREAIVYKALRKTSAEIRGDITLLLLLTPEEAEEEPSLMLLEFRDPSGARL